MKEYHESNYGQSDRMAKGLDARVEYSKNSIYRTVMRLSVGFLNQNSLPVK